MNNDYKKILFILSMISSLYLLQSYLLQPVIPLYVKSFGVTDDEWGVICTFSSTASLFVLMPMSIIADIIGKRVAMFLTLLGLALTNVAYMYACNFIHFLFIAIFKAIIATAFIPILTALLMDTVPAESKG